MKKPVLNTVTLIAFAVSMYILVFQGFGFPDISPILDVMLRVLAALCAQIFVVCNFKATWIRMVPMVITALLALWGGFLFLTSDAWINVTFVMYFADYCTFFLGCCIAWPVCKINFVKK